METVLIAITLIIPTFLDGITQFLGYRESNNPLRFTTGVLAGIGIGILFKALKWTIVS